MKKYLFLFILPFVSVAASAYTPEWENGYDVKINGIFYKFTGDDAVVSYERFHLDWGWVSNYSGNVVIPESIIYNGKTYNVTGIGEYAFAGCTKLTSVSIPTSVKSIGEGAFSDTNLTSFTIPGSVTSIGVEAFRNCTKLASIDISESVTSIGDYCFEYCTSLKSVTIPEGVTSIGIDCFRDCTGLTSATILGPATCKATFSNCTNLTTVNISGNVTSIDGAFYGCESLTSVSLPASLTSIGSCAFLGCSSLAEVSIPENVKSIGDGAFSECTSLNNIYLPESVTAIGKEAFVECESLTSVSFLGSVTSIGDYAFCGCRSLTDMVCYAEDVPATNKDVFEDSSFGSATLYVPEGSVEKYQKSTPWNGFGSIVPLTFTLTFTSGQMATIVLPTEPDASKGKYYRLAGCNGDEIIFEQELQPRAHVPYIIVPSEDFSIELSSHELAELRPDTVAIDGIRFIGSYTREELTCTEGWYIDIIDRTPDCSPLPEEGQGVRLFVGAMRAYLEVNPKTVQWDDPYHPGGTRVPGVEEEKMPIVLTDDPDAIQIVNRTSSDSKCYDLQGRQISAGVYSSLKRGIYIQNGRKVFVR